MERVLSVDAAHGNEEVHTEIVDFGVRPWLAGFTISAVQLTVGGIAPRRGKQRSGGRR